MLRQLLSCTISEMDPGFEIFEGLHGGRDVSGRIEMFAEFIHFNDVVREISDEFISISFVL